MRVGKSRTDAIVTTGARTGIETDIEKLVLYKSLVGDFPIVEGAGSNRRNVREHIRIVDGTIVGSYYKDWNASRTMRDTRKPPQLKNVKGYMVEANKSRDL